MGEKRVAIIIVTYNASEYLGELFSSLEKLNYPQECFEIVVVDNASQDETVKRMQNAGYRKQNIKLIQNQKNLGFAEGNNVGLRYALARNFDYAYLLNQDTIVDPNFLQEIIQVGESDQTIGAVQSLLLLWPKKDLINSWGNEIHYLGFAYSGGYQEKIKDLRLKIQEPEIAYASGAACLIRLSVLKGIGLFNQEFFMYHEDVDLGWRMWLAGFRVVLAPQSRVFHKYEFSKSIKKYYFMERNRYMVLLQNYSLGTILILTPALCLLDVAMLLYSAFGGFWSEEVRAFAYFCSLKNWQQILMTRKKIQATRRVTDREIIKRFTGVIAFQDVQNPLVRYVVNPLFSVYFRLVKKIVVW